MATPHTESARHVLAALKVLSIPEDKRALIERGVTEMDQELHEWHTSAPQSLSATAFEIDDIGWTLPPAYGPRDMTPQHRRLVALLLRSKRQMSRHSLYREITGREPDEYEDERRSRYDPRSAAIKQMDVIVCEVRKRLAAARPELIECGLPSYINTVWGYGYRLDHEERLERKPSGEAKKTRIPDQASDILSLLVRAKGKFVSVNDIAAVAKFYRRHIPPRNGTENNVYALVSNQITTIRRHTGAEIEQDHDKGYRLVP